MSTHQHINPLHDVHNHIFDLHVYPTYAVKIPQRERFRPSPEALEKANIARQLARQAKLDPNHPEHSKQYVLSPKATKRLINSVNWLVSSAQTKRVFSKLTGKSFQFKVNFITLTLPTTDHSISDHFFKSVLLHAFINTCRKSHRLTNFVWKCEAQANGNIHAHFTTDTFIHYADVRRIWNKILHSHGLIQKFTEKHASLTLDEYVNLYNPKGEQDVSRLEMAYKKGCESQWTNPNTTDVHAVHKIKDISAYLAKYMGKSEEDRRRISGRVWSCNYALSSKNKLVLECYSTRGMAILDELNKPEIKAKPIESINKTTGSKTYVGNIYFFKPSFWGSIIQGILLEEYNTFRWKIQQFQNNVFFIDDTSYKSLTPEPEKAQAFLSNPKRAADPAEFLALPNLFSHAN